MLRRTLKLTQEEFSSRFQILLSTLLDWEQGSSEPDSPSRAYLQVIDVDADAARQSLIAEGGLNFLCRKGRARRLQTKDIKKGA